MLYFLFATGRASSLRPKYERALDWFAQSVPLEESSIV